jgi:hypothetical protein
MQLGRLLRRLSMPIGLLLSLGGIFIALCLDGLKLRQRRCLLRLLLLLLLILAMLSTLPKVSVQSQKVDAISEQRLSPLVVPVLRKA